MTNEPIVGIPEEMALAISKALDLCQTWHQISRTTSVNNMEDMYDLVLEADAMIDLIEEALESYNEE